MGDSSGSALDPPAPVIRLPRPIGWAAIGVAVSAVVLAFVLPTVIRPDQAAVRPSTRALLSFLAPAPGQDFRGDPARVAVRLRLTGGRLVPMTSTKLIPDAGHVHLFLDGNLISMTVGLEREIAVDPGVHRLEAEFVAVDHASFDPRVVASVTEVRASQG